MNVDGPVILAFGSVQTRARKVPADEIYEELFSKQCWYIRRVSSALKPGVLLWFYQVTAGMRACATLADMRKTKNEDAPSLKALGLNGFNYRLSLAAIMEFEVPIRIAPIAADLDFVTNKKAWGQAFRSTPKRISLEDSYKILSHGTPRRR